MNKFTLINRYGGTCGIWYDYDTAENTRMNLDDWWLWTVVNVEEI